ncbi:hypothetical protein BD324DRAFT_13348 [Kockovaella imperatae]|uniref:Endoplasmic reticulum-based factor for assembly of V-ATPase-domain-containing protein n=1 Tax=Kockovaella imperatae TaxID=4999 RepID=A0A1Y1UTZ3_9TREE|nr:hypothetical protein BD324DRAFT_13348 [Kockovaella imperatae]ORX40655.1 hypothetical protein BD324DRAFT_13348 [Kockovaella imperatae]
METLITVPVHLREKIDRAADGLPEVLREELRGEVVPEDALLRLSKWAREHMSNSEDYSLVSLFAGTEVFVTPERAAFLKSAQQSGKADAFLPSYLSPRESLSGGYKALSKQITTALNVLFSVVGAGVAVYMAAITGAGYKRETGVLLGVFAAVVVAITEGALLWIFAYKVKVVQRKEVEMWKGSASEGVKKTLDNGPETSINTPRPVRLRRRPIQPNL